MPTRFRSALQWKLSSLHIAIERPLNMVTIRFDLVGNDVEIVPLAICNLSPDIIADRFVPHRLLRRGLPQLDDIVETDFGRFPVCLLPQITETALTKVCRHGIDFATAVAKLHMPTRRQADALAIQKGRVQSLRHCLFNHRGLRGDPQRPA